MASDPSADRVARSWLLASFIAVCNIRLREQRREPCGLHDLGLLYLVTALSVEYYASMIAAPIDPAAPTLPDLLDEALDVAFVGVNPSIFSAQRGHYFARPTNRFWPCISRSALSRKSREALQLDRLRPENDRALLTYGIGFTDLVKRATRKASDLTPRELTLGVETLVVKIDRYRPRVACFHGVTGYRYIHRALTGTDKNIILGPQDVRLGRTRIYLVPNPSGANAHFTPAEQTRWYDRLAEYVASLT